MENKPAPKLTLTLSPETDIKQEVVEVAEQVVPVTDMGESQLTPEERAQVAEFSKQIDVTNTAMVLQYGSSAQKNIASFSESALERVRTKDLGQVGDIISRLVTELRGFDAEMKEDKGFLGMFKNATKQVATLKARYDKVEVNVDAISNNLTGHQMQLLKDVSLMEKMYEANVVYFKELSMYILAGKKRLNEVRGVDLAGAFEKAKLSGSPVDVQAANDLNNMCERFEKKIHDLELTRMVSIQMAPQIRLIQNNDSQLVEKIQTTINNTIPLWKSQMVLALSLVHSQEAMKATREVTDMTNELLKKNADALKMGTVETAKEMERGIIDIETLKYTNQQLITTLDEVLKVQKEGREKRAAAETELGRIEGELKQKIMEARG